MLLIMYWTAQHSTE